LANAVRRSHVPARRPRPHPGSHRRVPAHRRTPFSFRTRVLACVLAAAVVFLITAIAARSFAPKSNTSRTHFDAIIVLGTPADSDGNPTPEMLDRVSEGVREYQRGVAPRLIVSGAAAHNRFVEAEVMARVAQAQGVPASVVFPETHALDTIQNACYSARILKAHGWHSAEVVSSASHLPRAGLIFSRLPALDWRVHPAPEALASGAYGTAASFLETLKTARYLLWTNWTEACTP
jgi:uncharacterized SAM-binding protein YcdF (DUF218 family)